MPVQCELSQIENPGSRFQTKKSGTHAALLTPLHFSRLERRVGNYGMTFLIALPVFLAPALVLLAIVLLVSTVLFATVLLTSTVLSATVLLVSTVLLTTVFVPSFVLSATVTDLSLTQPAESAMASPVACSTSGGPS